MAATGESFRFEGGEVPLAGERYAGGERGIVVLLHGGGQTRHSWANTGARLAAAGFQAIALDTRGHGDSGWAPDGDYTLDAFAGDLVAFAGTLASAPALVGASLGGITALLAAGEHPGLAAALVLVDVVVDIEPAGVRRIIEFMTAHRDGFASLEEVADAVAAYNPHRRRPSNLDGLRKNVRQHEDGRWRWHWDPAFVRIDDEPQRHIDRERLRAAARAITVPTMLVRGGHSDVVGDAGMTDMRRLIPHAELVEVGGAGHMVAGDDNDVFTSRLEAFLTDVFAA
jgi:pimeloyl-ACP methyl ester carboxylesterase